jgi:hypothetical protein
MASGVKTLRGPRGIKVVLDRSKVVPDDPGQDTPALVYWRGKSSTLCCAYNEGEVDGVALPKEQAEWLDSVYDEADEWLYTSHT